MAGLNSSGSCCTKPVMAGVARVDLFVELAVDANRLGDAVGANGRRRRPARSRERGQGTAVAPRQPPGATRPTHARMLPVVTCNLQVTSALDFWVTWPRHRAPRRSLCPVACTLDVLGDRWSLLVVRDVMRGKKRYAEFLDSPEGIPTNILADRLKRLAGKGMIRPAATASIRRAFEYRADHRRARTCVRSCERWSSGVSGMPAGARRPPFRNRRP